MFILTGDIGGTSARFGIFDLGGENPKMLTSEWLPTAQYESFWQLLEAAIVLLEARVFTANDRISGTVIAIAGPIENGTFSNPPAITWNINLNEDAPVKAKSGRIVLINDFLAQAYSCITPIAEEATTVLNPKHPCTENSQTIANQIVANQIIANPTIGVIGAGTGLGKSFLLSLGDGKYLACPSEGGHTCFAPLNRDELNFAKFVANRLNAPYAYWDDIVSGRGLTALHSFLFKQELTPAEIAARFAEYPDTLDWFALFFGRACRHFTLEVLGTGGLFIAGGIASQNPQILSHPSFVNEFYNCHTYRHLLESTTVKLISDRNSGLWGAAKFATICGITGLQPTSEQHSQPRLALT